MNGYEIINSVKEKFLCSKGRWKYYSRYAEIDGKEHCLDDDICAEFDASDSITQYSYETEYFYDGPGYEATAIFFAWTDNIGTLHTSSILTECM